MKRFGLSFTSCPLYSSAGSHVALVHILWTWTGGRPVETTLDGWFFRGVPGASPTRNDPPDRLSVIPDGTSGGRNGTQVPSTAEGLRSEVTLAGRMIDGIFAASLALASAQTLATGPAVERMQRAVDQLDALIREIRVAVFGQAASPVASG
jgi:hypothetical protein